MKNKAGREAVNSGSATRESTLTVTQGFLSHRAFPGAVRFPAFRKKTDPPARVLPDPTPTPTPPHSVSDPPGKILIPDFPVLSCFSHVRPFLTPWTVAHQGALSMGFPRQEYQSGLPCPPPGDLHDPGIKPMSPALQVDSLPAKPPGKPVNQQ